MGGFLFVLFYFAANVALIWFHATIAQPGMGSLSVAVDASTWMFVLLTTALIGRWRE